MESSAMRELRIIRDQNSKKHLGMSQQERLEELKESVDWLITATKTPDENSQVS